MIEAISRTWAPSHTETMQGVVLHYMHGQVILPTVGRSFIQSLLNLIERVADLTLHEIPSTCPFCFLLIWHVTQCWVSWVAQAPVSYKDSGSNCHVQRMWPTKITKKARCLLWCRRRQAWLVRGNLHFNPLHMSALSANISGETRSMLEPRNGTQTAEVLDIPPKDRSSAGRMHRSEERCCLPEVEGK